MIYVTIQETRADNDASVVEADSYATNISGCHEPVETRNNWVR